MTTPHHLDSRTSDRGFRSMPAIPDRNGQTIRVYESSAASEPCIWLTIDNGNKGKATAQAHLDQNTARLLVEQIDDLFEHHYQTDDDR